MLSKIEQYLNRKLENRKSKSTFRQLPEENQRIDFSSNDYLGFATDGLLSINAALNYSPGAKASRLISGNTSFHESVEKFIASYHNAESGLLFNSGYDANVGLLGCIGQKGDTIIFDKLCHASILDGLKMSLSKSIAFEHNDLLDLKTKLEQADGNIFVVIEGIYSMDGDTSPLTEIVSLCTQFEAAIIIDEAHSNGILGNGKGWVSHLGLEKKIFARVHTFGKAIGAHGAIVLGSNLLRNYLINYARSFVFTTAIPPSSVAHIKQAYEILQSSDRIDKLNRNIKLFHVGLKPKVKERLLPSFSPIQSIIYKTAERTRKDALYLQEKGFDVKPIVSPTVPLGKERIRICIHAFNSKNEIQSLTHELNLLLNE